MCLCVSGSGGRPESPAVAMTSVTLDDLEDLDGLGGMGAAFVGRGSTEIHGGREQADRTS